MFGWSKHVSNVGGPGLGAWPDPYCWIDQHECGKMKVSAGAASAHAHQPLHHQRKCHILFGVLSVLLILSILYVWFTYFSPKGSDPKPIKPKEDEDKGPEREKRARDLNKMVEEAFKKEEIVPDVIDVAPKVKAEVTYPSGVSVELGSKLTPRQVKDQPSVSWPTEEGAYYVLIKTDPDAPSRADPKYREWHHWLVGNIPGKDISKGDVLSAYIGAGPPKGTGYHRYIFLLYKQPAGKIDFTEARLPNTSQRGRPNFKTREFTKKYNLGNPIAGNFYQAEWDDYVPELYKQLSGN
jgi:phosphatidylethanolamine-binding protein (PEBP) family uncharacterized protein